MRIKGPGFIARQLRARPLACFAVAFFLGLLAVDHHGFHPPLCVGCLALAGLISLALRYKKRAVALALIPLALALGMARMRLADQALPSVQTRYSVEMEGDVASDPFLNPSTGRLIAWFDVNRADGEPAGYRLRLYLRGEEEALQAVAYGQRLQLKGHIWQADPVTNPYEFDFDAYLRRQGLSGYATAKIEDVTITGARRDARSVLIDIRQAVGRRIDALFPHNSAMMRALVLGDRSQLSEELRDALSRTGTAHLISISGLHVTVLATMLSLLLRRFMSNRNANFAAVLLLIPYGALVGFNAPFVRALVTFAFVTGSLVAGMPDDSVTHLCAAMLIYLLIRPLSVTDTSFVLSYAASAGIVLLMPPIMDLTGASALEHRSRPKAQLPRLAFAFARYALSLFCASLAAQLATLPSIVAIFGVQSVVSIPFNLVCVPLCMVGFLTGLIALLISAILPPLAMLLAHIPELCFDALIAVTRYSAALPLTGVHIGRYGIALTLAHWAVMLAASELSRIPKRVRRFLPLALVLVASLASLLTFARAWPFGITFLDADQADCAIVRTRGKTYMIDAGDTYTPAADYLNATCLHLDGVFLTHPHTDHVGGLLDVLDSFKPDALYIPVGWYDQPDIAPTVEETIEKARSMGVEIIQIGAGDVVELSPAARLTVYSPDPERLPDNPNDLSLLTLIESEGQKALFTGDLSMEGEPEAIPDTDILKVAHHGSDKATSERFLEACTPDWAIISVGENNYGHPGEETLDKLSRAGARVLLTRERGAITLTWRGGAWRLETYLEADHELE